MAFEKIQNDASSHIGDLNGVGASARGELYHSGLQLWCVKQRILAAVRVGSFRAKAPPPNLARTDCFHPSTEKENVSPYRPHARKSARQAKDKQRVEAMLKRNES